MSTQSGPLPPRLHRLIVRLRRAGGIAATRICQKVDFERNSLIGHLSLRGIPEALLFDYQRMRQRTLNFVEQRRHAPSGYEYGYSASAPEATLYASCYACMVRSLYRDLDRLEEAEIAAWSGYFNAFQDPTDGLFRDPSVANEHYEDEDWWGARHLAAHLIIAYTALHRRPDYDFRFLETLYSPHAMTNWLESRDWTNRLDFVGNEVMNHGVLLQFSRDTFGNRHAGKAVQVMLDWLAKRLNSHTGLWGASPRTPRELSEAVQAAYHIFPLYHYDRWPLPQPEKVTDQVLATQNPLGGFGVRLNSSACEDIDSIEPLVRLASSDLYTSNSRRDKINRALARALPWVLANMNEDGGFVFRRNEPLTYGHPRLFSGPNESSLFATWFRTLTVAYLINHLHGKEVYRINRTPGYEF